MRPQLILILFIFIISQNLKSQDTIVLQTGAEIKSKILEIGTADVKYKKFDNLNGPSYTAFKTDIFMIKYENGLKDVFGINNKNSKTNNTEPTNNRNQSSSGNTNGYNGQTAQNDPYVANDPLARLATDMVFVKGDGKINNFYICKFEVTQELWISVMAYNPSNNAGCNECPVEMIAVADAQEFILKLNKITGQHYRLPDKKEWVYASKGGLNSRGYSYSGGDNEYLVGWVQNNSNGSTHPIGQKTPNELGLYDMTGNVSEWCSGNGSYFFAYGMGWDGNQNGDHRLIITGHSNDVYTDVGIRLAKD
jgi:Sulfatase-modifying factor enzyme 1